MEIKPCPFCGGEAEVRTGEHNFIDAYVGCDACGAQGGLVDDSWMATDAETSAANRELAVENWNKRARA